ncbi:MAG: F0F1 ATP synthase subunit epsilon [Ignavibacteriae bacterium]|nr:F0F1 ATP synthase subunit epsilon [Ignavibacteriota bacterium]
MFDRPFAVEIITPEQTVLKIQAVSISAPGVQGGFQVLYGHAPLLAALGPGKVQVQEAGGATHIYATGGGFLEVRENHVIAMLDSAERAEDIDVARARAARDRAAERLHKREAQVDAARAEAALHRAMNRLRVAGVS